MYVAMHRRTHSTVYVCMYLRMNILKATEKRNLEAGREVSVVVGGEGKRKKG